MKRLLVNILASMNDSMKKNDSSRFQYLLVMCLFGCLGPIVRAIGLPSSVTACLRAWISSLSLIAYIFIAKKDFKSNFKKQIIVPMLISGVLIALDWIGLFESYNYTTIATATVCYYMVPIFVMIASPFVLKEKFTIKHIICIVVSFIGMAFVSGAVENGIPSLEEFKGVLFALFGALAYATIILINKKRTEGDPLVRTTIQLTAAAIITTPYILLTNDIGSLSLNLKGVILLLVLGVVLTAAAYIRYFTLILKIPARTVAIFSYADPVVAVFISLVFLSEPMTVYGIIGSVMIIGSAIVSELN